MLSRGAAGIAALLTAALVATPGLAAPADCSIEGARAVRVAKENGFGFRLLATDGTECRLFNASVVLAAPSSRPASCRFELFGERAAATGWALRRLVVSGGEVRRRLQGPGWILTVRAPVGETRMGSLLQIVARGPSCSSPDAPFK